MNPANTDQPLPNHARSERKRTPEMLAAICKLVLKGLSVTHAAEKMRVHHTTVGRWRRQLPEFDEALGAAEAAFIESQVATIRTAAKKNWQAAAWLLERKFPAFFSQPQVQLNMPNAKIQFEDLSELLERAQQSPEMMRALVSIDGSPSLTAPQEKPVNAIEISADTATCADET